MNIKEYNKVKDMTYREYCDYLQNKYGIGLCDYMTKSFYRNKKISRTDEGLVAHHKYEDVATQLSNKNYAEHYPFEWQKAENIVYCDYLEHLLLHILICQYPSKNTKGNQGVGYGGIAAYIVPELNDVYSGWKSNEQWRKNCYDSIINDRDVYLILIKRLIKQEKLDEETIIQLKSSWNDLHGDWDINNNEELFAEFDKFIS